MPRILLAEDEEHIAKLIEFKLKREGYDIVLASDGEIAITLLDKGPFDLVLLDVMMPHKDGWQVLEELRRRDNYKDTPVLMLTAKGHAEDYENATKLGASGYIKKPFDPTILFRRIEEVLREKKS